MRSVLILYVFIGLLASAATAHAERRIFIIANNADGYGADRCLASGAKCGAAMAAAYCRSREYKRAITYRKVGRQEITGAVPLSNSACSGGRCEKFVAIECAR
jgi:hypothetical protein